MSALYLLFSRQWRRFVRRMFLTVGYEPDSRAVSERFYLVYVILIFGCLGLFTVAYLVVSIGTFLASFRLPLPLLNELVGLGLALRIVILPAQAYGSFDLFKFELPDLFFLSHAPFGTGTVGLAWWLRRVVRRETAYVAIFCALLASTASYLAHGNDLAALAVGGLTGLLLVVFYSALMWCIALLRYRGNGLGFWVGYIVPLVLLLLLILPWTNGLFGPAWLSGWLLVGRAGSDNWGLTGLALLGLAGLDVLLIFGVYQVARLIRLAPALEEGQLGGHYRLSISADRSMAREAGLLLHMNRQMYKKQSVIRPSRPAARRLSGLTGALLYRLNRRLIRQPWWTTVGTVLTILATSGIALGLVNLSGLGASFSVIIQGTFLATWALLRRGVATFRHELAHPDFMLAYPTSRLGLMARQLGMGFLGPLVVGELALLLNGWLTQNWTHFLPWLGLWALLVGWVGLVALAQFQRQLKKWDASLAAIPNVGPGTVLIGGSLWLAVIVLPLPLAYLLAVLMLLGTPIQVRAVAMGKI